MKLPGIFVLTTREQRAVILIVMTLLAATIAKRYFDHRTHLVPTTSAPVESSATPSLGSAEDETREPGE